LSIIVVNESRVLVSFDRDSIELAVGSGNDCSDDKDHDHDLLHQPCVPSYLPEAHHQLLMSDNNYVALFDDLKGQNHHAVIVDRQHQ
jgi:hypothetical protein